MRFLFTTAPLAGHFFPLVPLAWAARTLGHEVLVATSADFVPVVLHSGLPATAVGPPGDFLKKTSPVATGTAADRRWAHGRALAQIARQNLKQVLATARRWRPDVVISERAEWAGPAAAAALGIPRAELRWGVAPLTEFRAAAVELLGSPPPPDAVLTPWPPSLQPKPKGTQGFRHVPYNGDARIPAWLLEPPTRPRVCVTLGTVLPHLHPATVEKIILPALDMLPNVEVVIAADEEVVARWASLPKNTRHAGRLPLAEAIQTCEVALHHGGQGTALAALAAARPQVVLPHFDDHFANATAITKAGAGTQLLPEELTPERIAEELRRALTSHRMRQAATRVATELATQPHPTELMTTLTALSADQAQQAS